MCGGSGGAASVASRARQLRARTAAACIVAVDLAENCWRGGASTAWRGEHPGERGERGERGEWGERGEHC